MLLWLLAFWLLAHGAIPGVLDMLGLEREELASHGQVTLAATPWRRPGRHARHTKRWCRCAGGGRAGGNAMHAVAVPICQTSSTRASCVLIRRLCTWRWRVSKLAATLGTLWRCCVPIHM